MSTDCTHGRKLFQGHGRRQIEAAFDGGTISSDGGGVLLLRQVEQRLRVVSQLSQCFVDGRDHRFCEHTVPELIGQRVFALALGYEDLNDHDELRHDPALALLVGKRDITGQNRVNPRVQGKALAGKSTLNRLELPVENERDAKYKKIQAQCEQIEQLLVDLFIQHQREAPSELVLDLDATDDPLHGAQEGRFFHGYYDCYCYLPLYVFCGDFPLVAKLRPSGIDPSDGAIEQTARIVSRLRQAWPNVRLTLRADSGFCREELMSWCESNDVHYVFGLARNGRLQRTIEPQMAQAKASYEHDAQHCRVFTEFMYSTLKSWSRERRVIAKAQYLGKENPRFIVTDLDAEQFPGQELYEQFYCARGEMENRIKEQQLWLFADRTSTYSMQANQLRLWFSTFAYILLMAIRDIALCGTSMARATCQTIRLRLFKIAARIHVSVRRVVLHLTDSCPYQELFWAAARRLRTA